MLLQERIEELGSGILNVTNSKVELIGFMSPERLNDYYSHNRQCYLSIGIYKLEPLDFAYIQDDALFIINNKDENSLMKYQFELLKKDTVKYKNYEGKHASKVYYIRKCRYTGKYNYKDIEKDIEKGKDIVNSILFDTREGLYNYFKNKFNEELKLYENITDTLSNILESMIVFNDMDEKISKFKEWKLLSPKADELKDIYYKNKSDTVKCEIIGYLRKKTNSNCIDKYYETAVIKVDHNIIKIAPSYLLEMQKKDFSFDFIAIDFETANKYMSSACSIGLVAIKNNEVVDTFYSLIKPSPYYFDERNIEIHGITIDYVKDAPTFPEVWKRIKKYFDGNTVIAHNAIFDMTVLKNCFIESNMDIPDFDYLCSIPISNFACHGEKTGNSLKDKAAYFDVEIENHHNAISDAMTCAELVLACIKKENCNSLENYISISNLPVKHFTDLIPQKEFVKSNNKKSNSTNKFNKINISEIVAETESIDTSHEFYGKTIVFTGELSFLDRKTAMQKVVDLGGKITNSVSSKTNYLIVGKQDKSIVGDDGMSTKEKKAYELNKNNNYIQIISEDAFLKLINQYKLPIDMHK
jgi:DNA polymerase III subunit epsilon